ncbi:hypothetical protein BRY73_17455 [Ochrobactrum sp. P6BS-III]|nr:nanoRNase/pAp phosphatase (c-di-AMP/oligoRNAs hydrolase) [Ochrobactrum sp. P6BSIII]OOL15757.1 hypothetical protein BRY73_17455 [Ochrobactrum sp. P6BS-III]
MKRLARLGIAAFLGQNFKHKDILINGALQKTSFAVDCHDSLIKVPFASKARCAATNCMA